MENCKITDGTLYVLDEVALNMNKINPYRPLKALFHGTNSLFSESIEKNGLDSAVRIFDLGEVVWADELMDSVCGTGSAWLKRDSHKISLTEDFQSAAKYAETAPECWNELKKSHDIFKKVVAGKKKPLNPGVAGYVRKIVEEYENSRHSYGYTLYHGKWLEKESIQDFRGIIYGFNMDNAVLASVGFTKFGLETINELSEKFGVKKADCIRLDGIMKKHEGLFANGRPVVYRIEPTAPAVIEAIEKYGTYNTLHDLQCRGKIEPKFITKIK